MKPVNGLNRDTDPFNQPEGTYRYASNAVLSEELGSLTNAPSDDFLAQSFESQDIFLGWVNAENKIYAVTYNNNVDSAGKIYEIDEDLNVTKLIQDPSNFLELDDEIDPQADILQLVWRIDNFGRDVITWVGKTRPKYVNIGQIIEDSGPAPVTLGSEYSTKAFLLSPEAKLLSPSLTVNNSGGSVTSGAWFFTYRYEYPDGSFTDWSILSPAAYVPRDEFNLTPGGNFNSQLDFIGNESGIQTGKSISIDIDVDTEQPDNAFIRFAYVTVQNGVTSAALLQKISASFVASNGYTYNGGDVDQDLGNDITDLITPFRHFKQAQTITSLTNRLYLANYEVNDSINFQTIANDITVGWEINSSPTVQNPNLSWSAKGKWATNQSFGAGEVYAFYIHINYTDGSMSPGFHIPGRKIVAGEDSAFLDDLEFQVDDTATLVGATDGGMGYWRNETEVYPDISDFPASIEDPNTAGNAFRRNVRHHRFPSLGFLYRNVTGINPWEQFRLSAVFSNIDLSSLSADEIALIDGFTITYAKKEINENLNIAYDWPTMMGRRLVNNVSQNDDLVAIPGNWAFSNISGDGDASLATEDIIPEQTVLKFHALHLLNTEPAVSPKYVAIEERFDKRPTGSSFDTGARKSIQFSSDTYTQGSDPSYNLPYAHKYAIISDRVNTASTSDNDILDVTDLGGSSVQAKPTGTSRFVRAYEHLYLRTNVKTTISNNATDFAIDNTNGENALLVTVDQSYPNGVPLTYTPSRFGIPHIGSQVVQDAKARARFIFSSLRAVPSNVSAPFTAQTLVNAGSLDIADYVDTSTEITLTQGDWFFGAYQFNATGVSGNAPLNGGSGGADSTISETTDINAQLFGEGAKITYVVPVHSPINHTMQYSDASDTQSLIYPISGVFGDTASTDASTPFSLNSIQSWTVGNQNIQEQFTYLYDNSFNQLSEYVIWGINDGIERLPTEFPYTIQFTEEELLDDSINQWRIWPALNKYIQPPNKGPIINLKGAGNQRLYIHHSKSLFITKDRTTLQGTQEVTLGSSDIFQVVPYEIITIEEGYTGLKNRNWFDLNPMGYCWVNDDHGKIFLHDGQNLEEISANGMRTFFRDFISQDVLSNSDAAFSFYFDENRKNLMFRSQSGSLYTISYSSMINKWVSFHDQAYSYPIVTSKREILTSDDDNVFGLFNADINNNAKPFIVEMVVNVEDIGYNYLKSIEWSTAIFDNADIEQDETFNRALIYSSTKTTGLTTLVPYTTFPKAAQNIRRVEKNWFYNQYRDLYDGTTQLLNRPLTARFSPANNGVDGGKQWFEKSRMRDKFFYVRLEYQPPGAPFDNKIGFSSLMPDTKPSRR